MALGASDWAADTDSESAQAADEALKADEAHAADEALKADSESAQSAANTLKAELEAMKAEKQELHTVYLSAEEEATERVKELEALKADKQLMTSVDAASIDDEEKVSAYICYF